MQINRFLNQRKKIITSSKITRRTGERRPQQVKGVNRALLATPWSSPIDLLKLSARFMLQNVKYWTPSPVRIESLSPVDAVGKAMGSGQPNISLPESKPPVAEHIHHRDQIGVYRSSTYQIERRSN
jgi:hypothetical protein